DPPAATPTQVQIIAFPARDFTSSSGYTVQDATVEVQVIRNNVLVSTANVIPVDDPTTVGFDGVVEVNHPGGGCWLGATPELRAGPGEDGVLTYDTVNNPDGTKFTATYTGLNENDVARALGGTANGRTFAGAESRIIFLGLPTVVAPEMTIYENSDLTISGPA